ncbi:MAG: hypothetical protein WCS73_01735 [Lentisphaeria bacterium]
MTISTSTKKLLEKLDTLKDLNPDISEARHSAFVTLANEVPKKDFPEISRVAGYLLKLFLSTPTKQVGEEILNAYFKCIEESGRLLAKTGEIHPLISQSFEPGDEKKTHTFSKNLVPYIPNSYTALEQCKILNRASIPQALGKAADAFRRRLGIVNHITSIAFEVLWRIDPNQTEQWFLKYLEENDSNLDPEIIEDILEIALRYKKLSPEFLTWVDKWCDDQSLIEFWPGLSQIADRIYCRHALKKWDTLYPARDVVTSHLHKLIQREAFQNETLSQWLATAMECFGDCVERFLSFKSSKNPKKKLWKQVALFSEMKHIISLYKPILILSDQLLYMPDGAARLAMALLGLVGEGLKEWEEKINKFSEKVIRRLFLKSLRDGKSPLEIIKNFTFGDKDAYNIAYAELDLISQQFDSIAQRDKVVAYLAAFYSSFRKDKMISIEITRRYRNLMRFLHEDYLRNTLSKEDFDLLEELDILHNINGLAAAARHYLDKRHALQNTIEEMLAGEMEFKKEVRSQRLTIIRKILKATPSKKA